MKKDRDLMIKKKRYKEIVWIDIMREKERDGQRI